jgi:hypothetical protein
VVVALYPVKDQRIRDHLVAVLSIVLPEDILLNIFECITVHRRDDRHWIVQRERNYDYSRFPYGQPGGYQCCLS